MNATMAAVLAEAGGPAPPSGGDVVRLMHHGGWALFAVCLLGFVVAAATMAWRVDVPEKFIGLVLLGTVLGGGAGAVLGSVF